MLNSQSQLLERSLANQSQLISTQVELNANQNTEVVSRIDNVGLQLEEFTNYLQEKDADDKKGEESSKKKKQPPKKTPPAKKQRLL